MKTGEMGAVRPQASDVRVPRATGHGAGTPHLLQKESAATPAVLDSAFRTVRSQLALMPVCGHLLGQT